MTRSSRDMCAKVTCVIQLSEDTMGTHLGIDEVHVRHAGEKFKLGSCAEA